MMPCSEAQQRVRCPGDEVGGKALWCAPFDLRVTYYYPKIPYFFGSIWMHLKKKLRTQIKKCLKHLQVIIDHTV